MRKRPLLLATAALAAGLAVYRTVSAQVPAPVSVSPPARTPVRPYHPGVAPAPGALPAQPNPVGSGRQRLTQPVTATADGVRPAAAFDLPPPNLDLQMLPPPAAPGPQTPAAAALPQPPAAKDLPPVPGPQLPQIPAGGLPDPQPLVPVPAAPAPPAGTPPAGGVPLPPLPTSTGGPAVPAGPSSPAAPVAPTTPVATPPVNPAAAAPPAPFPTPEVTQSAPVALRPAPAAAGGMPVRASHNVTVEAICPESVSLGAEFRYELVVRNAGNTPVAGVRVEDDLPPGTKYVGSDPQAEQNGDRLGWSVGSLDAGGEKRITVRVKPGEEGEIRSRATVTYSATVEARTRVTRPRISVAVTGPEVSKAGEEPVFHLKVTNSGSGPAQRVLLAAQLSEGLVHPHGSRLEMQLANLPAGETRTVALTVSAVRAGAQWCQVTATTLGSQDAAARATVNVLEPRLQLVQTGPAKCFVRHEPVYELTLSNPGTAATDPVNLFAVLPEGFDYVQANEGATFNPANRAVVWKLAGLAPGATKAFTLKLRAVAEGEGLLRTIAQAAPEQAGVAGAGGAARPAGKVLEAKADTPVKAEGVAAVRFEVRDLEDPIEVGGEATYEVRVLNQGTGACTNVQIVAALADGTTYTGSSGPTQAKAQGQSLVFDPIANLAVKGEAVYRVKVRGTVAGDTRFRVQLTCDQVRTPVVKEESTQFVKQ